VIPASQQQQIAEKLDEVVSINTDATNRSLQVALLIPIIAGLIGLFNSFRMMRLPDVSPSTPVEGGALA
jgi:hypothetical protein